MEEKLKIKEPDNNNFLSKFINVSIIPYPNPIYYK